MDSLFIIFFLSSEDLEKDDVEVTLLEDTPVEDWVVDDDQEAETEIEYDIYQLFD